MFRLGGTDDQSMARIRDYLATLTKGWPVEQLQQIVAETLDDLMPEDGAPFGRDASGGRAAMPQHVRLR